MESFGVHLHVVDSTVTGNGVGPDCPHPLSCADLYTPRPPRVADTQCDHSRGNGQSSWNVCQDDN